MGFEADLERFTLKLDATYATLLPEVALAVQESIVVGSPITGAPGQPVDTGNLRASWNLTLEPEWAEIITNVEYAPFVEDGVNQHGPMTVRSLVGGWHSVALTRINFDRLVDHVVNRDVRPEGFQQNFIGGGA